MTHDTLGGSGYCVEGLLRMGEEEVILMFLMPTFSLIKAPNVPRN